MGIKEIILIIACCGIVAGVIISKIVRKKQHKCDCGCESCTGCTHSLKRKSVK